MHSIEIKKKIIDNGEKKQALYYVPALALKNSDNKVRLLVPHPNGNDIMEFESLAEAAGAIRKAGFEYKLPEGEIIDDENIQSQLKSTPQNDLDKLLFNKFKTKTKDINSSVASAALTALSYLNNKDALDIYIENLGEDNEKIRTAAIDGIVNFQGFAVDKLIDTLTSPNWVARNSAISCLVRISEFIGVESEKILIPIINRIEDDNTIVQANAILAAGKIYKDIIKKQNK